LSNLIIAQELKALERKWPRNLMLFSASGTLLLVDSITGRVISRLGGISCDGGDPNIIEIRGEEYMEHFYADFIRREKLR